MISSPGRAKYHSPSSDPKWWAGSYLAQQEAAAEVIAARWGDVDMEDADYIASHQEYEQADTSVLPNRIANGHIVCRPPQTGSREMMADVI